MKLITMRYVEPSLKDSEKIILEFSPNSRAISSAQPVRDSTGFSKSSNLGYYSQ